MSDLDTSHSARSSHEAATDGRVCRECKTFKCAAEMVAAPLCKGGIRPLCKECWNAYARSVFVSDEAHRARVNAWRAANPEKVKALQRAQHEKSKDKRNAASRIYRQENLEAMRQMNREWSRNNPEKMRATNTARRAAKGQAIPHWAGDEFEVLFVKEAYDLAVRRTKLTGMPWHVDHVVPLRSRIVCGLHCAANLRVITGSENHSKGNRVWPDMPMTDTARAAPANGIDPRQNIQPQANAARPANAVTRAATSDGHPELMRTNTLI